MKNNFPLFFLYVLLMTLFASCIKDTDFNQADNITVTPIIELDFIYFNLNSNDYFDEETGNQRLIVTDTTQLKFLDDDFAREDIKKVDFYFKFNNSISRDFITEFKFLRDNNVVKYQVDIPVLAGSINAPTLTEHFETIENDDIRELTKASQVVINVIIPSSIENVDGTLELQSKATYFLEI